MATAKNGIKVLTGIGAPASAVSPRDLIWSFGDVRLWRYRSDQRRSGPPLLVVHSLVTRSYVFDLSPGNSFVEFMVARGFDVYLVDWGEPDATAAHYDLDVYCRQLLPDIVNATVSSSRSRDVVMMGYCLGGLLSLLYAAAAPDPRLRGLITVATPLHFEHLGPVGAILAGTQVDPGSIVDHTGNVPSDVVRDAFRMMQPSVEAVGYADLWQHLWNDEFVAGYQIMTRWGTDHVPMSGAVVRDLARIARSGDLALGEAVIGGDRVSFLDIHAPFLAVTASRDHLVPPAASGALSELVGSSDSTAMDLPAGHVGIFLGRSAQKQSLPAIVGWLEQRMEQS
jgi:polyhydroxyalkanoate synthase